MALRFGTSGVRGLVTDMTDRECYLYARAFARYVRDKSDATTVALAGDLRSSTPRIMRTVAYAIDQEGLAVDFCGRVATPAVMNYAIQHGMASIMVTGSHIPDDRNGIKFNMPWGEVLKADEQEISRRYASLAQQEQTRAAAGQSAFGSDGAFKTGVAAELGQPNPAAQQAYIRRFIDFFPAGCLRGLEILFYQHSSVSREVLPDILQRLGAEVINVGFSQSFVPVDTEAVQEPERLAVWVRTHGADTLVSTDGDGDRPLVVDETGKVVRGDVLGILVSDLLAADSVSTPVSCNTALEKSGRFTSISRTRIGSPYVVESMNAAVAAGHKAVVGYEANGGYLTASDLTDPQTGAVLKALPTRDAALPIIAVLRAACQRGMTLSALVATLPPRYTASGLLRGFPNEQGKSLVARFQASSKDFAEKLFSPLFGPVEALDFTDGARITFVSGDIVHLRPSGNAPEFRCYTESSSEQQAVRNNELALQVVEQLKAGM